MNRIHRLDPTLVNQIAAGEVVERPASIVKELVENAIDAGARRIDIELEDGGLSLIRVVDDGGGILPDDLPLAVAAHATSKLATADDLARIATLGFRGEALASIAAVARLRIVSRPPDADAAAELRAEPGRLEGPTPCAAPVGTAVEVRNLFFNLPARRKFLRQPSTELTHVTEQIARVALSHPHIAFSQVSNGRTIRNLPAGVDRRGRLADFYGPELAEDVIAVHRVERDLTVDALIAPPASARASSKWQYVFLNGRYIADRAIQFAIREAYRGLVEPSRYPVAFLFLTIDPSAYDVNVHPTKTEVRWRDHGLVQSQVLAVLREALLSRDLTPAWKMPDRPAETASAHPDDSQRAAGVRAAIADFLRSAPPAQRVMEWSRPPSARSDRPAESRLSAAPSPAGKRPSPVSQRAGAVADDPGDTAPRPDSGDAPPPRALQVHNTYLVVETDEGVLIVDQHALHERVLFEQFSARILSGPLESQRLLIPETVEVSPAQLVAAEQHAELLALAGLELSRYGPHSFAVQAFPTLLARVPVAEFVRDALDRLAELGQAAGREALMHALLDMMACKAAVKAGDPLSPSEIEALLAQRGLTERASNCPHGRPTTLSLSLRDLERQFKRG